MQQRKNTDVVGIDVSHWQGVIDWQQVKASGVQFAFIKASEGTSFVDSKLRVNAASASAAGIKIGFYHYSHPTNDPIREVNHFLNTVKGLPCDLPLVLDLEEHKGLSRLHITAFAEKWLEEIQRQTKKSPLLYTYTSFASSFLNPSLKKWPIWIAQYTKASSPNKSNIWDKWDIWQYTDSGTVAGIKGKVDMNFMDRNYWNKLMPSSSPPTQRPQYNQVIKERIHIQNGQLHHSEGNYKIKATDVRRITFQQGQAQFRFVYEKGAKVSELVKKYGADYGFNGPFFFNTTIIGDARDRETIISSASGKSTSWHHLAFMNGKPVIDQITDKQQQKLDLLIQGAPLLVKDGQAVYEFYRKSDQIQDDIAHSSCQRTFVWLNHNGDFTVAVADGRTSTDVGLTLEEMARYALSKGAVQALNLDGGGSSIIADRSGGLNQKSNTGTAERPVSHALLVFTKPQTTIKEGITTMNQIDVQYQDKVSGKQLSTKGYASEGKTYVELREVANFLGASVSWNAATKQVTLIAPQEK